MARTVGIRYRRADKIFFCSPGELTLKLNTNVIVRTDKGEEYGWVAREPRDVVHDQPDGPTGNVMPVATSADVLRRQNLEAQHTRALRLARENVREMGWPFKIIDAHYTFDGSRVVFFFSSETRADFRNLIRRLSAVLQCRVELKQVGARDEAKIIGGIERCGLTLCCSTWLTEFSPVTVRMAKEQALPVSADGLAGQCGRLRCCLKYEYEQYRAINKVLPRMGEMVGTPFGEAKVIVGHKLKETASVIFPGEVVRELPLAEVVRH